MQNFPQGLVRGLGTGTSDSIVARVSKGEYILPKAAVDMIGKQKLNKIKNAANAMRSTPGYAMGGLMDDTSNRPINIISGSNGQQNDLSTANSMNRAAAIYKSMQTPVQQQPTQDQKMRDAFKTFSGLFGGGGTPEFGAEEQKPMAMGSNQKNDPFDLPRFAGGGSFDEDERARQALLHREKPIAPIQTPVEPPVAPPHSAIGTAVKKLVGRTARVAGKAAPYATGALAVYDVANRSMTKGAKANEIARDDMASNLASRGMGGFEVNNITDEQYGTPEDPRVSARQNMATLAGNIQNAKENKLAVKGADSYDRLLRTGVKGDTTNFLPPGQRNEAQTQEASGTAPTSETATTEPKSLTPFKPYTIPELQAAGPGEIVQPKGNRNTQYAGTITTTGTVPLPDKMADLSNEPMPLVTGSRVNPKTGKTEPVFGTRLMSQRAQAMGGSGTPQNETRYSVIGDNGGTGTVQITGPSQRKGGGTVSVMDQGNGGTVEGNVAAMERQTAALRSLREAQNPGITTGTGQFGPRMEAPSTDPFNGDRDRRAKYESLLDSAANERGLTKTQRAAKIQAAGALVSPGEADAKLRADLHGKRMDQATEAERNAAQRMQTQAAAEDAAAQRQQAQSNADRNFALSYDNQKFGQIKDRVKFDYDEEKALREWGSGLSKEAQDEAMDYYKNSGDGKGNNRTSPADLALLGTQLISNGKVDITALDNLNPGLVERINTKKLKRTDYFMLEKIKRAAPNPWIGRPDMAEAVNRVLSGQE